MIAPTVIASLLAVLWGMDGVRLRSRAHAIAKLSPDEAGENEAFHFVLREGISLDDALRKSAIAVAATKNLRALDLVDPNLPAWRALLFLQSVDIAHFKTNRLAAGRSAGDAILVDDALWEMLSPEERAPKSLLDMTRVARKVKLHACTEMDFAVAFPESIKEKPHMKSEGRRADLVEYVFGEFSFGLLLMQLVLVFGCISLSPRAGLVALFALQLQLAVATLGTSLSPRGLLLHTLFRAPVDFAMGAKAFVALLFGKNERAEVRRPIYDALLEKGTTRFFEPRRETCPICNGSDLAPALRTVDRYGFKPGLFTIERCADCKHLFQNPRLSIEGLDFYYRDFYDGLGEGLLDTLFSFDTNSYELRAQIVSGISAPQRWLDVGAGHGHFCCIARETWTSTRFDGLDLSESIDEAKHRGWIDDAYRGLFPEVAEKIASSKKYDVVSMSHYLEHTRDPRAEIEAAKIVLADDGLLMIEVPDPESRMGKILGSFWVPWFQPQHQHLLSVSNLSQLLRANHFEPLVWHRGEAHQTNDLTFFVFTLLNRIGPPLDLPWKKSTGALRKLWRQMVWCPGLLLVGFFWAIDQLIAPALRREGWSNTYRVLARRTA